MKDASTLYFIHQEQNKNNSTSVRKKFCIYHKKYGSKARVF